MMSLEMTVVIPADSWRTIVPVIESLAALSDREALEVVVALPRSEAARANGASRAAFGGGRIVEVESALPLGLARAAGIRAATGRSVFIGETHSFPREGMFRALARAHAEGCTMAVPSFHNWNPDGAASWAGFIIGYAPWTPGREAGHLASAPIFNVSYSRSFLMSLGDRLDAALSEGEDMLALLRAGGHDVRFVPDAAIEHANISGGAQFLRQRYLSGRVIAGTRSMQWSGTRRAVYAIASPLVPFVLFRRHRQGIARVIRSSHPPRTTAILVAAGMVMQAIGEMAGYVSGDSDSVRSRYDSEEIRRLDFVRGS